MTQTGEMGRGLTTEWVAEDIQKALRDKVLSHTGRNVQFQVFPCTDPMSDSFKQDSIVIVASGLNGMDGEKFWNDFVIGECLPLEWQYYDTWGNSPNFDVQCMRFTKPSCDRCGFKMALDFNKEMWICGNAVCGLSL